MRWWSWGRRRYVPIRPGDTVRVVGSDVVRTVTSMGGFGNSPMDYFLDGAVVPCRVYGRGDLVLVEKGSSDPAPCTCEGGPMRWGNASGVKSTCFTCGGHAPGPIQIASVLLPVRPD